MLAFQVGRSLSNNIVTLDICSVIGHLNTCAPIVQVSYIPRRRSLSDLHSLGPSALACVNHVETSTSVYNLYLNLSAK